MKIDLTNKLENKIVLVTGGHGFLGRWICELLAIKYNAKPAFYSSIEYNLTDLNETLDLFDTVKPDYVIHAAGHNGGIEFNRKHPAEIFSRNTLMAINIHHAATHFKVEKLLSIITSCAHPDVGLEVLPEDGLWDGPCNPTVDCHGYAKRNLQFCADVYNRQYNLNSVCCCLTNLFGPGDTFDFGRTKVVGAIIRRVVEAKEKGEGRIVNWGTGAPLREFMYVIDAADAVIQALIKYEDHDQPLNIGSGKEISIKELVEAVVRIVGYKGDVLWDADKGDGQMKKLLDTQHMRELLDVQQTEFFSALSSTVEWYKDNKDTANVQ